MPKRKIAQQNYSNFFYLDFLCVINIPITIERLFWFQRELRRLKLLNLFLCHWNAKREKEMFKFLHFPAMITPILLTQYPCLENNFMRKICLFINKKKLIKTLKHFYFLGWRQRGKLLSQIFRKNCRKYRKFALELLKSH